MATVQGLSNRDVGMTEEDRKKLSERGVSKEYVGTPEPDYIDVEFEEVQETKLLEDK